MKQSVGVFFGGASVEHEISVISALQAINALDNQKYDVVPIYITKQSEMYTGKKLFDIENFKNINRLLSECIQVSICRMDDQVKVLRAVPKLFAKNEIATIDVALPVVHGTNCEDGTLQGFFEILRLPYVGCDVISSAIGMDKVAMKQILQQNGIPVVEHIYFYNKEWVKHNEAIINTVEEQLGYPVIVKPANLGSSVGISKASNKYQLEEAINMAQQFANKILIEKAIVNLKEINCSVIGDYQKACASVCEEPISSDEILSYKDKYLSNGSSSKGMSSTKRKLPAELPEQVDKYIREMAVATFKILGCSGVARIDFLIDMDQTKVYVNEINTIPGSLSFYLWEASGKSFSQLLDELIALAYKRERERNQLMYTYETNIFSLRGSKGGKA